MKHRRNVRKYRRKNRGAIYSHLLTLVICILLFIGLFIVALEGISSVRRTDTVYETQQPEDVSESSEVLYLTHPVVVEEPESITYDKEYIHISEFDADLISKLLWFEARGECDDCKRRVVSVVINRMTYFNMSAHDVIYAENQFEPAAHIEDADISEDDMSKMRSIVDDITSNGPTVPGYVTYFRAGHFHNFRGQVPYISCCNTYVSYDYDMYMNYITN